MSLPVEVDSLYAHAMKGEWHEVAKIYEKSPEARKAKLTKSEDTALHIAVAMGRTETAVELVEIVSKHGQPDILKIAEAKGNTALHLAAALGDLSVCKSMASKSSDLITIRNHKGETPLFLAARHGKKEAFLFLYSLGGRDDFHVRRNDGDTILHAAIIGGCFSLAMIIIHFHPKLADAINENGLSPLHILAHKPNAFRSGYHLGLVDRIIYHCLALPADDLNEEVDDIDAHNYYPANYKTIVAFFRMLLPKERKKNDGNKTNDEENPQLKSASAQDNGKQAQVQNKTRAEENPNKNNNSSQGKNHLQSQRCETRYLPPNYNMLALFLNLMIKAVSLIIFGFGIQRIDKIRRKKQLHKWANLVMNELGQLGPGRITGVALQMQWEIKWYKFVKHTMPLHFFHRYNNAHQTPKEIFSDTHKSLAKKGGKWLVKTAESCSLVAALVTTVTYATVTGVPLLMDRPAFRAFALSSLAALCFSITSLVFFLSILTPRYHEKDFDPDLPRRLLFGLTSLFASIAAMLVSFCKGHVFILPDNLRFAAYPLYAAMCFPIMHFALSQLSLYFDLMTLLPPDQRSEKAFLRLLS